MRTSTLSIYCLDMMKKVMVGCWFLFFISCTDPQQPDSFIEYYFPPINSTEWEEINFQNLGWDELDLEELLAWLPTQETRAFVILKDGKIVVEEYWGDNLIGIGPMNKNSIWYWASAGKTLTATLIGLAQEEELLSINDRSQKYLGSGWTSLPNNQEQEIRIHHHLSMTTGLDDAVQNPEKTSPENLIFKEEPGKRWAYHNAPYTLLDKVIERASGKDFQSFFKESLGDKIGMKGSWQKTGDNNVFYSDARSMAKFGLLLLANGKWDKEVIWESEYFKDLKNNSQSLNESYGYLTWLNGKNSFMLPQSQMVFSNSLVPSAPADMYQAIGKNGQFLMVIPSENMVVVRMGEAPGDLQVPFLLIQEIWDRLNPIID